MITYFCRNNAKKSLIALYLADKKPSLAQGPPWRNNNRGDEVIILHFNETYFKFSIGHGIGADNLNFGLLTFRSPRIDKNKTLNVRWKPIMLNDYMIISTCI